MRRLKQQAWLAAGGHIVGLLAVTYASLSPSVRPPADTIGLLSVSVDQLLHACAYGLLGLTACRWLGLCLKAMGYLGLLALYGGGLELAQTTVPSRSGSWGDFLANVVGLFLSLVVAGAWLRYRDRVRHTIVQSQVTKTTQAVARLFG